MRLVFAGTMRTWTSAPSADRDRWLDEMARSGSEKASRGDILACMNSAGTMEAHSSLIIADVYEACSRQSAKDNI